MFKYLFIFVYFSDLPIVSTGQPVYYPERGMDTILACSAKNATAVFWQRLYASQRRVSINSGPAYPKYSGGTISNPSLTVHQVTNYDDGEYLCIGQNSFATKSASTKIISGSK